jgi:hypothetical protein
MAMAEASHTTKGIFLLQVEIALLTPVACMSLNVLLAVATSAVSITAWLIVLTTCHQTITALATCYTKVVVVGQTLVAFVPSYSSLAGALAITITLQTQRTDGITVARLTGIIPVALVIVVTATLAVGAIRVALTILAVSSVPGAIVQVLVEEASCGAAIAITGLTFIDIRGCSSLPWFIIVEW